MKKLFIICSIILGVYVCFLTCSFLFTGAVSESNKGKEVIEETEFFKITRSNYEYYYCIYDKNHNIIKSDGPLNKKPDIILIKDGFIRFTLQTGTGVATQWGYFYDIEDDKFSRIFQSIYDQYDRKVIYGSLNKLIVSDIFNNSQYYKEISTFSRPLSKTADSIVDAKFIKDGNSIEISYMTGEDYEIVTEIVDLFE